MHRVAVIALPGVYPFELGIAQRVFGTARSAAGEALYDVVTAGLGDRTVRTASDFDIVVSHNSQVLATADTVVVPAALRDGPIFDTGRPTEALRRAFSRVRPGTRLVSICTGAYALAALGLLDGRPATNHWRCVEHFQRLYPRVLVRPDVLFVDDGDVLTSAGAAAGVDLCLHLVRNDHGSQVANSVARRCVVPPWREGGQAQYIEQPVPEPAAESTAEVRDWVLTQLDQPLPLGVLAARASMSVRTFTRRFRGEVGMTPGAWLTRQRVELARRLLEITDLPIERIARQAGFGTAASLRRHLRLTLGVSPASYRRTFRRDEPEPAARPSRSSRAPRGTTR